ncbi:hypothetical protein [Ferrovibrio sp.]|uniref:hypothetical protein n=1 Tax=Ferrovibrio sp. TaxID=1917215 RepID=UPI0025BD38FD|nr:hypothetical protein [Ferrovibrio sp.]
MHEEDVVDPADRGIHDTDGLRHGTQDRFEDIGDHSTRAFHHRTVDAAEQDQADRRGEQQQERKTL